MGQDVFTISELQWRSSDLGSAGYIIDAPGYYLLSQDLTVPSTDFGILILAESVTLDLGGHTILDAAAQSILIRVASAIPRTTIRNGIVRGGSAGIVATGSVSTLRGSLTIDNVTVLGAEGQTTDAIVVSDVSRVWILSSSIGACQRGVSLSGVRMYHIEHNRIVSSDVGIEARLRQPSSVAMGEIRNNSIHAERSVWIGTPGFVEGNSIAGSMTVSSEGAIVTGNRVAAVNSAYAMELDGWYNLVDRNILAGGTASTIGVLGEANRVAQNRIFNNVTGSHVLGDRNIIEGNTIRGALSCGIELGDLAAENVVRDNSVPATATSTCGQSNPVMDNGMIEEIFRPTVVAELGPLYGRGREIPRTRPTCPPSDVVMISDVSPVQVGSPALVIDRSGYYVITEDLLLPYRSTGIHIEADDVTLDLAGHTITCELCDRILSIDSGHTIEIRNGELRGGYFSTLTARGTASLVIDSVTVECSHPADCGPLHLFEIGRVELLKSQVISPEFGISMGAETGRIFGTEMISGGGALAAEFRFGATIERNLIHGGQYAADLLGDNVIQENVIGGGFRGGGITLHSGKSRVVANIIDGGGNSALVTVGDETIIERNLMKSGGIVVASNSNEINRNLVYDFPLSQYGEAIEIRGGDNTLDGNLVFHEVCGIDFVSSDEQPYRNNVVFGASEGVCGAPNFDEGGNIVPASTCGNGVRGGGEVCDGLDRGGLGCQSFGYASGGLTCNAECDGFAFSGCLPGTCGNGIHEGDEWCDGDELGSRTTCLLFYGFDSGELRCGSTCDYDLTGCELTCGNGIRRGSEVCDGGDFGGQTCEGLGFQGGTLGCASTCDAFDTSSCTMF